MESFESEVPGSKHERALSKEFGGEGRADY